VLNNAVYGDNRIPPYGMAYTEALERSALPVPTSQYGGGTASYDGMNGVYEYWDVVPFDIPSGAVRAEVQLLYQATSWEYIQFLWKQPTSNPLPTSTFLADEGVNMMDAWLNARLDDADPDSTMAPPHVMATTTIEVPEPGELALLAAGIGCLAALARRRERRA
jgi:hypothetical protein